MDPELKAALEAIRRDMATKADLDGLASKADLDGLAAKTDLDDLAAKVDSLETSLRAEIRAGDEETRRHVDAQGRDLRDTMAAMEARLTQSIENRREDIDALGADVLDLQRRVKRLEQRGTARKSK